jgi:hypothetical protein
LSKRTENDGATPPGRRLVNQQKLLPGWDEERVRRVLRHYEEQTEVDATAEDEDVQRIVESDQEANR